MCETDRPVDRAECGFPVAECGPEAPCLPPQNSGFEWALSRMRLGKAVRRRTWKNVVGIALQIPDTNSKMCKPYLYCKTIEGCLVPWMASHADLLGYDWEDVPVL